MRMAIASGRKIQKVSAYIITVLTILLQHTHGQSYLLTLGQSHRNFISEDNSRETFLSPPLVARLNYSNTPNLKLNSPEQFEDNNTTIIVIKSIHEEPNELSETAMDVITIVWYVATFLALAAFFMLMACSDRRCNESQRNTNHAEAAMSPPTPSPSYSEFAPPSYESVIKAQHMPKPSVFVVPFAPLDGAEHKDANSNNHSIGNTHTPTTPTTPTINFYIVNEVQKCGS